MPSWLDTFRKPQVSPVASLAERIATASFSNAEALKTSICGDDKKHQMQCWFAVLCEFLYFFMHLTNRFAYGELGHGVRCKLQVQLYPLVVGPTLQAVLGHWPKDLKDGVEAEFGEKLNTAEIQYAECRKLVSPENPFAEDALFSKFAGNICELLGVEKTDFTSYAEVHMRVTGLTMDSFKELNLPETIRAIGKEL